MNRLRVSIFAVYSLANLSNTAFGATALPSVTVNSVATTSPVVRATSEIAVSASVIPTFDTGTGPATAQTSCTSCAKGNNYCGTGNSSVKTQQVLTTTSTTVANQAMVVKAAPEFGAANPTIVTMSGGTWSGGVYQGSLPTPLTGVDGIRTVTVTAYLSEDVTTTTTVTTNNMNGGSCGGALVNSFTTGPTSATVTKFGSGSGNGSYILDINAPAFTLKPVTSQRRVQQGGSKVVHNVISGGSAKTNYSLINSASGPNGSSAAAQGSDAFGPGTKADGIAPDKHDMVSIHIPCSCATGDYSIDPSATVANTVDLLGNPFSPISVATPDAFTVDPGLFLQTQTLVVSELPPIGDYAEMACFSGTMGGNGKTKVILTPGSLHITATVKTTGPCSGFGTINNPKVSLTLPPDFIFADSGNSPAAHVFVGPSAPGFDFHNPVTMIEVTSSIPKPVVFGQTVTVDLSNLQLSSPANLSRGQIPSDYTIYVRAHAVPDPSLAAVPADGKTYSFYTSVQADLPTIANGLTADSSQQLIALPAAAPAPAPVCVNGGVVNQ